MKQRFDLKKLTRRNLFSFLLLALTAPKVALEAWKAYRKPVETFDGVLNGRYKVYADPNKTRMTGYKGTTELDAGYMYAPYIPLQRQTSRLWGIRDGDF